MLKQKLFQSLIILTTLICLFGAFFFTTNFVAHAESDTSSHETADSVTLSVDEYFALTLTATSRSGQRLQITDPVNGYYCLKWRDVNYLEFKLENKLPTNSWISFTMTQLYKQTDDLNISIGSDDRNPYTLKGTILNDKTYRYYTDKTVVLPDEEDPNTNILREGQGFGLYKFDFNYAYILSKDTQTGEDEVEDEPQDEEEQESPDAFNHLELNIAILPDYITQEDIPTNITLSYDEPTSSDKFLNVYHLYISDANGNRWSIFDYVNPECLRWNVTGTDTNNIKRVLCNETKNTDNHEFETYEVVWDSLERSRFTGSTFVFDSNNIEGNWVATLTIIDKNENVLLTLKTRQFTTIKSPQPSYWWIYLIVVLGILLIGGTIFLIIYLRKKKQGTF